MQAHEKIPYPYINAITTGKLQEHFHKFINKKMDEKLQAYGHFEMLTLKLCF
jgi:hypothetical protein